MDCSWVVSGDLVSDVFLARQANLAGESVFWAQTPGQLTDPSPRH